MLRRSVLASLSTTSQRFMLLTKGNASRALSSRPRQTSSRVSWMDASGGFTGTARDREIMWASLRWTAFGQVYGRRSLHELRREHRAPLIRRRLARDPALGSLRAVLVPW